VWKALSRLERQGNLTLIPLHQSITHLGRDPGFSQHEKKHSKRRRNLAENIRPEQSAIAGTRLIWGQNTGKNQLNWGG